MRTKAQRIEVGGISLNILGNCELVYRNKKLGVFCSVKCPGNLILKAYKFAHEARNPDQVIVGGFQSPIEKDCLRILLQGPALIVFCLARGLSAVRLPSNWRDAMGCGRLLLASQFGEHHKRVTTQLASGRNRLVASLSEELLIVYAHPGGKTEMLASEFLGAGKRVYTFQDGANDNLIRAGLSRLSQSSSPPSRHEKGSIAESGLGVESNPKLTEI